MEQNEKSETMIVVKKQIWELLVAAWASVGDETATGDRRPAPGDVSELGDASVVRVVGFVVHHQSVVDEIERVRARLVWTIDHVLH